MADKRPDCYWEGDVLVIRASSFGGCIGSLVRSGIGMTPAIPPADIQRRWDEGTAAEPAIIAEVERQGWVVAYAGEDEQLELELKVGPRIVIRCHPDGLAVKLDDAGFPARTRVLEAKFLRPSMRKKPFPFYQWQSSIEQAASGFKLLWAYGEKDEHGGHVMREGHPLVELVPQDTPPYSLIDIKKRALAIYRAVVEAELPDCDWKQYPCGYYREDDTACGGSRGAGVDVEALALPDSVVSAYVVAKRVKEDAEKDFADATAHIKGILADRPGDKYRAGDLTFSRRKGSRKLDRKKLEKDMDVTPYLSKPGADVWTITES